MSEISDWLWMAFYVIGALAVIGGVGTAIFWVIYRVRMRGGSGSARKTLMFPSWPVTNPAHTRIGALDAEVQKLRRKVEELSAGVDNIGGLQEAVRRLQVEVDKLRGEGNPRQTYPTYDRTPRTSSHSSVSVVSAPRPSVESAATTPDGQYRLLLASGLKALDVQPKFASLDMTRSSEDGDMARPLHVFSQTDSKQEPFIIFVGPAAGEGYLYPNPLINFTAAMGYVFPMLSYEAYESAKSNVAPVRVEELGDNLWRRKQ